jgi:DNA invertase Pin-like site-specific DNA recombinase
MLIGYARVSTGEQNLSLQRSALEAAGCDQVFEDRGVSGTALKRPALEEAMRAVGPGDVLTVWKLDRLGRSLPHLLQLVDRLKGQGAGFRSLTEAMDTTTPGGELIFHVMAALAQFERSLIVERTRAGMQAARERGRRPGRKPKLTPEQLKHARELLEGESRRSPGEVAKLFNVDRSTLWRALRRGY